ncbi:hypothetical protein [Streptomyces hawaiiensis]|jgi:hypothetical protein|uniref:Uncharacterized protein n=1 Tax=Streptomyces hawaiiensis TaxID=67305 RepID=A0A6G5RNX9_9ACTN|nr:hypothetical protein [Streptomyces hawaiiensis]QCD59773.1 hypothetical protein CEB94_36945 [Streptomyces hawaiiensis]
MTTTAPLLDPRVIALAHYAVLESVLTGTGVRITDAGRERYATTSGETAPITARIYDGIPAEDLAVAGRVLRLITGRADAEPAALRGEPDR